MKTSTPTQDLGATYALAHLLERLDHSTVPVDAAQYRSVVVRLAEALAQAVPGAALTTLLERWPATAEVYENINYQFAGLCRSNLDLALAAEIEARRAIERAIERARGSIKDKPDSTPA